MADDLRRAQPAETLPLGMEPPEGLKALAQVANCVFPAARTVPMAPHPTLGDRESSKGKILEPYLRRAPSYICFWYVVEGSRVGVSVRCGGGRRWRRGHGGEIGNALAAKSRLGLALLHEGESRRIAGVDLQHLLVGRQGFFTSAFAIVNGAGEFSSRSWLFRVTQVLALRRSLPSGNQAMRPRLVGGSAVFCSGRGRDFRGLCGLPLSPPPGSASPSSMARRTSMRQTRPTVKTATATSVNTKRVGKLPGWGPIRADDR